MPPPPPPPPALRPRGRCRRYLPGPVAGLGPISAAPPFWTSRCSTGSNAFAAHQFSRNAGMRESTRVHFAFVSGAVAQLGERSVRNAEVVGSTPIGSTNSTCTRLPFRYPCPGSSVWIERPPPKRKVTRFESCPGRQPSMPAWPPGTPPPDRAGRCHIIPTALPPASRSWIAACPADVGSCASFETGDPFRRPAPAALPEAPAVVDDAAGDPHPVRSLEELADPLVHPQIRRRHEHRRGSGSDVVSRLQHLLHPHSRPPRARPLEGGPRNVVSPADGAVIAAGSIHGRRVIRAKDGATRSKRSSEATNAPPRSSTVAGSP